MTVVAAREYPMLTSAQGGSRVSTSHDARSIEGIFEGVGPGVILGTDEPLLLILDGEAALVIEP